ncbi:hypothetical protein F4819DRAFT_115453 [Hypoxylon fuscum]|nr:hypothetical protein F4819DRAFT_115453 [Hypoxylon fuscum]
MDGSHFGDMNFYLEYSGPLPPPAHRTPVHRTPVHPEPSSGTTCLPEVPERLQAFETPEGPRLPLPSLRCQLDPAWRIDIYSNGECDTARPAPRTYQNNWVERGLGRNNDHGFYHISGSSSYKIFIDPTNAIEFRPLLGGYKNLAEGIWVIFFDGMRFYPGTDDARCRIMFGPDTRRTPRFITRQGEPLASAVLWGGNDDGPLFSWIPRDIPVRTASYDQVDFRSPLTRVCLKDHRGRLMTVPNGRLMIWLKGTREEVPFRYLEMLRERAWRVNTMQPMDLHPHAMFATHAEVPEVPDHVRQVITEIGSLFRE